MAVALPESFKSVSIEQDGEVYLVEGTREEMVQAIRDAGYRVKDSHVAEVSASDTKDQHKRYG